jgi:hypothetical protein
MGAKRMDSKTIGTSLSIIGTIISIIGVIFNNIFLLHYLAMLIWVPSNLIFFINFLGRRLNYWDGHLTDTVMCINYLVMLLSGLYGISTMAL